MVKPHNLGETCFTAAPGAASPSKLGQEGGLQSLEIPPRRIRISRLGDAPQSTRHAVFKCLSLPKRSGCAPEVCRHPGEVLASASLGSSLAKHRGRISVEEKLCYCHGYCHGFCSHHLLTDRGTAKISADYYLAPVFEHSVNEIENATVMTRRVES
jgi:hypothetical protein